MSVSAEPIKPGMRISHRMTGRRGEAVTLVKYQMQTRRTEPKALERGKIAVCWTGNHYEIVDLDTIEAYRPEGFVRSTDGVSAAVSAGRFAIGSGCYRAVKCSSRYS